LDKAALNHATHTLVASSRYSSGTTYVNQNTKLSKRESFPSMDKYNIDKNFPNFAEIVSLKTRFTAGIGHIWVTIL